MSEDSRRGRAGSPGAGGPSAEPRQASLRRLRRFGVRPNRELGQNFLIDDNILRVIGAAAELAPEDVVLEVGGGLGVLSEYLAPRVAHLHVVEVDRALEPALADALEPFGNTSLHLADAVRLDLRALDPAPAKVVANLPYGVAATVLLKSIEELPGARLWVAMVQREVADRFAATPGTKSYGATSVLTQLSCDVRFLRKVPRTVFHPAPNVESALILMRRTGPAGAAEVSSLVHAGFAHRRKALGGSLALAPGARDGVREATRAALERLGHPPDARAERLPPEDWPRLAALLEPIGGQTPPGVRPHRGSEPAGGQTPPGVRPHRGSDPAAGPPGVRPHRGPSGGQTPRAAREGSDPAVFGECAYAKLNLVLHVGRPRADGLHPLCSLFASIELADEVHGGPAGSTDDSVDCPGVTGTNLALTALDAFRRRVAGGLPPIALRIEKRIPVAAGLGGGSADAAAAIRIANTVAGGPLGPDELRELAAALGSDVPSQIDPRHALVRGTGELVEPVELPPLAVVLVPDEEGLSTAAVYAELDRLGGWREALDPEPLRQLAAGPAAELAAGLENDLEPVAVSLRPSLADTLERLRATGALGAAVSGSGPTCFGLYDDNAAAAEAAAALPGAILTALRAV